MPSLGQILSVSGEALTVAFEAEETLTIDAAQIKAGQPATTPPIGGSIEGVAGKFTVTFTPNVAPAAAESEAHPV